MRTIKRLHFLLIAVTILHGTCCAMEAPMDIDKEDRMLITLPDEMTLLRCLQEVQLSDIANEVAVVSSCASKTMPLDEIVQTAAQCIDVYGTCIQEQPFLVRDAWRKYASTGAVMHKLLTVFVHSNPDLLKKALAIAQKRGYVSSTLLAVLCYEELAKRNELYDTE